MSSNPESEGSGRKTPRIQRTRRTTVHFEAVVMKAVTNEARDTCQVLLSQKYQDSDAKGDHVGNWVDVVKRCFQAIGFLTLTLLFQIFKVYV